jgi:hypothetical protein
MAMTLRLYDAAHWRWIDDFAVTSADAEAWSNAYAVTQSWGGGALGAGGSGYIETSYTSGLESEMDVYGSTPWTTTITNVTLFDGATALWEMEGSVETDNANIGGGVNEALLLAGADILIGNSWNNKLEGFAGNDYIDGGAGFDTGVLSGSIYNYTYVRDGSTITTSGFDGFDTMVGVERLEFDDYGIAFDIEGNAGQAYRLYQAAFDRVPDLGGLGYQMDALDDGLYLSQVAGNFIASPEFQTTYGALSNSQFVTQLYYNVLDRAPDSSGLNYHVARLNSGVARADVLVGFSESPENKANVIGQIDDGMLYIPQY